jgi:hypothetical protein
MIKIEIPQIETVKSEYLTSVRYSIVQRIEPLIESIQHLNGGDIDLNGGNFERYKHISRKIVNKFIDGNELDIKFFNLADYTNTVRHFIDNVSKKTDYANLNFSGLIQFLEFLIYPNTNELDRLLICEAANLKTTNDDFLSKYSITGDANKFVLARAFNYEDYDADISVNIKSFFRRKNFVKFCPYCNLTEVEFIPNEGGIGSATSNELDHFFDKASFPLLNYSFFNIVPSDGTCNGPNNKGSILFTDKYHSNPYTEGFEKKMVFKPIMKGKKVDKITVEILAATTETIFLKMLGSGSIIDETSKEGNINVFSIYSKYSRRTKRAEKVLSKIYKSDKGSKATIKLFKLMAGLNEVEHYKSWYETEIDTYFDEERFHEYAYSKFNRDIHDFYFKSLNNSLRNNFIRRMI